MKIQSIYTFSFARNNKDIYNISDSVNEKYYYKNNSISDVFVKSKEVNFKGTSEVINDELSYEKFIEKYQKIYGDKPINEVISDVIYNAEDLNRGSEKRVFTFPKMEDYVIGYYYKKPPIEGDLPLQKCEIPYSKYNFGQPIAQNGYNIIIMKRVNGVPNSVNDSFSATLYVCKNNEATREMAQEYLSKLKLFEHFPQESYDNLAKQIKYLADNCRFFDALNNNNLLIDTIEQKFHLIDIFSESIHRDTKRLSENLGGIKQGVYEMIGFLLEPRSQCFYLDKMTQEEQKQTQKISRNVIKKCFAAAKKESLSTNGELQIGIYNLAQEKASCPFNENFSRRYGEFLRMYKKYLH